MKFSIITVNYNGERFLEQTIQSVLAQDSRDIELEYIIIDGGSTDGSLTIIDRYKDSGLHLISEPDNGPADALNKGFQLATGEVIAWLNADDLYYHNTLARVKNCLQEAPEAAFCFGRCSIINEHSDEIRQGITKFKELFFPISSRFTYRCINYISQPALFFKLDAVREVGLFKESMVAAWDYEFVLRLWSQGTGRIVEGSPLACFRWHEGSISGRNYSIQFKEEYEAARDEAGRLHPAVIIHLFVRWLIIGIYSFMALGRKVSAR